MLERAKAAMMKPFVVSLMADPSGAYTTAAAMVALRRGGAAAHARRRAWRGQRVLILGGTGPVGRIAGVLAAQARRRGVAVEPQRHRRGRSRPRAPPGSASASRCTARRAATSAALRSVARRGRRGAGLCGGRRAGGVERGPGLRQAPEGGGRRERRAARGHCRRRRDGRRQAAAPARRRWASARWRSATSSTRRSSACWCRCARPRRRWC